MATNLRLHWAHGSLLESHLLESHSFLLESQEVIITDRQTGSDGYTGCHHYDIYMLVVTIISK